MRTFAKQLIPAGGGPRLRDAAQQVLRLVGECAAIYAGGLVVYFVTLSVLGEPSTLTSNLSRAVSTAFFLVYVCWRDRNVWRWGTPSLSASSKELALLLVVGVVVRGMPGLERAATLAPQVLRPSESIALTAVVLAPIAEEVFFRGFMLKRMAAITGLWPALAISGLLFGLVHFQYAIGAALTGAYFGWIYSPLSTGYLVMVIVVHAVWNLTGIPPEWVTEGF